MRQIIAVVAGFLLPPLIFLLFSAATTRYLQRDLDAWAQHDAALEMTRSLLIAVELYRRDHSRVVPANEGLDALVPLYLHAVPNDPWGRPFVYHTRGGDWADVLSHGADGVTGGSGTDTDVSARYGSPGTSTPRLFSRALFAVLLALTAGLFAITRIGYSAAGLAGGAFFWGAAVAATLSPSADLSLALIAAFTTTVLAIAGAILCLRAIPQGPLTALVGALTCQVAAAALVGALG